MTTPTVRRALPPARRRLRSVLDAPEASLDPVSISLDSAELAGLLTAVAVAGRRALDVDDTLEGLILRLWLKLHRADRPAALSAFSAVVGDRAPLPVVLDLAELLTIEDQIHPKKGQS